MTASLDTARVTEGFMDVDGQPFYAIPNAERLAPFLMSIVSDSDHWMFLSSRGGLTAGRGDARSALFPYETDDRLHQAAGTAGPVTAVRVADVLWTPLRRALPDGAERRLFKSLPGNQVVFEEIHPGLGLAFRYRWATSGPFGFVRTTRITNLGRSSAAVDVVDGLVNLLPHGLAPSLYQEMSNLTNAYKRSELTGPGDRLAVYTLEARIVDRAEPSEALQASTAWSTGFPDATVSLSRTTIDAFEAGHPVPPSGLVTGQPGAYLLAGRLELEGGQFAEWHTVADVDQSQSEVVAQHRLLQSDADLEEQLARSMEEGTARLVAMAAAGDGLQCTGDRVATAHQFANVTFNVMRGGTFLSGYQVRRRDYVEFIETRNRAVAADRRSFLDSLPELADHADLLNRTEGTGDPQLVRLTLEYLPLSYSRRHGDPSRPWNDFSIRVRDDDGNPVIHYEGNWRDIFQNWEGLALSFPEYLPSFVSVFVNSSTIDGFNPYRITRAGIDWEVLDPDDPWSNIGYWGDHQIVYLLRLLEATQRYLPGRIEAMLDRSLFSYADIPYRIASYDEMVRDPRSTIRFDDSVAARIAERVAEVGNDGKLLWTPQREVHLVTLLEKLLVPALAKLSNYVPDGGIWMNTQRPEWNDANNALAGHGLSMVTLCHLRAYLDGLGRLADSADEVGMSTEVADWLSTITGILSRNRSLANSNTTDRRRKDLVDELGWAYFEYRSRVYASGPSGLRPVTAEAVRDLCEVALEHLDGTIRRNRRPDGLYHSYNVVAFEPDEASARVEHLDEMLEGQVAVLSAGLLDPDEKAEVIDALFASRMYDPRRGSFMLYPPLRPRPFLEKNVVPARLIDANPLLAALVAAGDRTVVVIDADGRYRFQAAFRNAADLDRALEDLSLDESWTALVEAHRDATLDAYEAVFRHHRFTGRSGSMYAYEGIGSIYWHMVAKLLVAVQEALVDAAAEGAAPGTIERLREGYWRVRSGLGFNKSAEEYGAFPADPYSHSPAHAGAQQPGMTGQVKEELLTRLLETGVRIADGEIRFDPMLLRDEELLAGPETWAIECPGGSRTSVELPSGSLGMTLCQVPVIISPTNDDPTVEILRSDGTKLKVPGTRLPREISQAVFRRTGEIERIEARL